MKLDALTAVSPIDGRYNSKTQSLSPYFSEYALIRYRVRVEIEYFITLCELPLPQLKDFDHKGFETLRDIYRNFTEADAQRVKTIEQTTNHDVKAVEYFIKEQFDRIGGLDAYKEFIHFGLTSQDINNTSVPLSIKEAIADVYRPCCRNSSSSCRPTPTNGKTWPCSHAPRTASIAHTPRQRSGSLCLPSGAATAQLDACPIPQKFVGPPATSMPTTWPIRNTTGERLPTTL
jgi:hypothetical protein